VAGREVVERVLAGGRLDELDVDGGDPGLADEQVPDRE